ncbi:MAG: beta-galactosidase [Deltaproteobacteria bacterium]|nr:beta-galactosidase [Deltaproteobacteria bacterium]
MEVGGRVVPLRAGAVHYWRLDPRDWRRCLEAVRGMGLHLVDLYVPWSVHEIGPGELDFGRRDERRDVAAFLRLAAELDLFAIVRPGPHVNAELTDFGLPARVLWDPACQARSAQGNPVVLPMLPRAFPVPSYASRAFLAEVARYFAALGPVLAPLCYPEGPIVLVQIDNEGAMYFRDGAYDQDYHPDAMADYRAFLQERYGSAAALPAAYARRATGTGRAAGRPPDFADIWPPVRCDAARSDEVVVHLDWAEAQERLLADALGRFGAALEQGGLVGLPTTHNLPPGEHATALCAARVSEAVSLVGLDYYGRASAPTRAAVARRTSELAIHCAGRGLPPFACEMGAGHAPYFPPLAESDSAFVLLVALAYGLRGFNAYMAVERDRWLGAPVDRRGRPRPFAAFWRKLGEAWDRVGLHLLRRRAPVRLVVPRTERRLARVLHAFGPATPALFALAGQGPAEACGEDDLGLGYPLAIEAHEFAERLEQALDARGIPFALVDGDDAQAPLGDASWIVCATSGALGPELRKRLAAARRAGARVTIGPRPARFDAAMQPWGEGRADPLQGVGVELLATTEPALLAAAIDRAVAELGLPRVRCEPEGIFATALEDDAGAARVLFAINPGPDARVARVFVEPAPRQAQDLITDEALTCAGGAIELALAARSVRMLAVG